MSRRALAGLALCALLGVVSRAHAQSAPQATAPQSSACAPAQGEVKAEPIDLNTADERALLELPGIGPARARAIVAYRAAHGGFRSISQLLQIKGIGRALLRQLRPLVTLSS